MTGQDRMGEDMTGQDRTGQDRNGDVTEAPAPHPGNIEEPPDAPWAPPPGPDAATRPEADLIRRCVEGWIAERIRNSPVARATEAWNHLMSETEGLIRRLETLSKEGTL